MKKKLSRCFLSKETKKLWRIMRLLMIFSFCFAMTLSASIYSQNTKLSLDLKNISLREVFDYVEQNSQFIFLYKNEDINIEKKLSINLNDASIDEIMMRVLEGQDATYRVFNRQIVISKSNPNSGFSMQYLKEVKGTVKDKDGMPLPGVTVVVKGTNNGTITDADGQFSLPLNEKSRYLVITFVGMKTQEIELTDKSQIEVILVEETIGIEEVVAIGYGTRKKSDLTGSISTVSAEELTREVKMSPELAMQGKMAGVYISNPGSDPTARPTVRIRGVGTLGYSDPLYVIDGIPLTEGGASATHGGLQDMRTNINVFSMINPNDIESISVLKDASATAIYGVRASNGVILIQTKRGKVGKPKVNFSASYGVQNIFKRYDVMSVQDYAKAHMEAWTNNPSVTPNSDYYRYYNPSAPEYLGNSKNYTEDWVNAGLVKNAAVQDYNVNLTGGTEKSTYSAGAGYTSQENAVSYSKFDRYSFFLNSDHTVTNWLKLGESYRLVYSNNDTKSGTGGVSAAFNAPWQPVYDKADTGINGWALPYRMVNGSKQLYGYGNSTKDSPGRSDYITNVYNILRTLGTFYAEITPMEGLRIKGTLSFDYSTNTNETFSGMERGLFEASRGALYDTNGNTYRKRDNINSNIVKELLIGYNKKIGNHNVDIVLNAMDQKVNWIIEQKSIDNNSPLPNWDQRRIDEGWPQTDKGLFINRMPSGLQGYMGRLSYNFNSKYYLDATVRRDGTSKFGPGYKWGTFPSFAAAWRISSEKFMENISWLDDLKLRAGWGQTGNQETRDFAYLSLVNFNPKYAVGSSGTAAGQGNIVPAAVLGDFPIVDMSWETATNLNVGFDAVLLNNKMTFTTDYYHRTTDGILQTIDIPWVIGALNNPVINLATVINSGFEFQASYTDKIGDLGYNVMFNLTTVKNDVQNLYRNRPSESNNLRIEEGYSMNYIFGYKTDGIFQSQEEVTSWLSETNDPGYTSQKSPGDVRFVDINGAPTEADGTDAYVHHEKDGKIDSYDRTYLGKTIPGYYYGFSLGLNYKSWDASMNFRGVGDVQRINTRGNMSIGAGGENFLNKYTERWTSSNPSATIPRAIEGDPSGNNRINDRMVEDAGFLRFQNFQVGYKFKGSVLKKIGASDMRCYLSGSNLFVVTPYTGLDPENDTTPVTFSLGVNVNF